MAKKDDISYKEWKKIGMVYFWGQGMIIAVFYLLFGMTTFSLATKNYPIPHLPDDFQNLFLFGAVPPLLLSYGVRMDKKWIWPIAFLYFAYRINSIRLSYPYNIIGGTLAIFGMAISLGGWISLQKK